MCVGSRVQDLGAEGGSAKKGSLIWFPVGAILNMIIVDSLLGFCKKTCKIVSNKDPVM